MAFVRRRAASEVLGAIIIAVMTIVMAAVYASYSLVHVQTQTASISEILRTSAKAQRQLLSLSYYYVDGQGKLHVFVYNMGNEASTLKTVFVGSTGYSLPNPSVQMRDAVNQQPISDCVIGPKQLAELITPASAGQIDFLVLTVEGGVFVWRLSL